jgi:hypothetical protein
MKSAQQEPGARSTLRQRLDSWRLIAVFGALYGVSQVLISLILRPVGIDKALALQLTTSASTFAHIVDDWRAAGLVPAYLRHFYLDFLHPVWYAVFLAACLAKALHASRASARLDILLVVPFVAAGLDLVENVFHIVLIRNEALITPALVAASGLASNTKWALAALSLAAIGVLALKGWAVRAKRSADLWPSEKAGGKQ